MNVLEQIETFLLLGDELALIGEFADSEFAALREKLSARAVHLRTASEEAEESRRRMDWQYDAALDDPRY